MGKRSPVGADVLIGPSCQDCKSALKTAPWSAASGASSAKAAYGGPTDEDIGPYTAGFIRKLISLGKKGL